MRSKEYLVNNGFFSFLATEPVSSIEKAKRNAEIVLQYSTAYPFRVRGKEMLCVYCQEEFTDPNDYRNHIDECHKSFTVNAAFAHCVKAKEYLKVDITNLRCRVCSTPCDTLENMAAHIRDVHGVSQINMDCEIRMHPYRLFSEKWVCALCDKNFATLTQLCRHTTSHYQKFGCDVCGRKYLTSEALKYHTRCSHSGTHMCRKCWTDFPTLELKREHVRISVACWPFCCTICGERFVSGERRQSHLVEVHGQEKKVYECPDCDQIYKSRRPFYNHYTLVHSDNSYKCTYCVLKFSTKKQMEEHRFSHTGKKPFHCNVCSKTFSRRKNLQQHIWIHSETKRFICAVCDKQFAQNVSLKCHLRSYHPEIVSSDPF
ncbi:jg5997 [Pararge aegeria aegeria]|uniref:Jg5997 protein n=3 Tax=Pararge aegeria TaxID=116150 RepID=A0A8S4SED9_9NEOP|nr:jg5997 [Pararge aegeria aegeria]